MDLFEQIARLPAGPELTVRQMLEAMQARAALMEALEQAEQIGPPRWINGQTCQVQLQITGAAVSRALLDLVAADPQSAPVTTQALTEQAAEWEGETFSATGASIAADAVENLRPPETAEAWANVNPEARRQAIVDAHANAIRSVMGSINPITVSHGGYEASLEDAFRQMPLVRQEMQDWLSSRPVTSVEFRDDLQVELVIHVPPAELAQALRQAVQKDAHVDLGEVFVERLGQQISRRLARPVGRGKAPPADSEESGAQTPAVVPPWIDQQLDAEGTSGFVETQLKTARAAEAHARAQLREQVTALAWCETTTVGEAAESNPLILRSLENALDQARITRTEYEGDQAARVYMTLDLKDLWEALRSASPRAGRLPASPPEPPEPSEPL